MANIIPVVTASTVSLAANAAGVTIQGFGFDTVGTNSASFSSGAASAVSATSANSVTFSFSTAPTAGKLMASVTSFGQSSGTAVQVATISPVVNQNLANPLNTTTTNQVVITGVGFDPAGTNTVAFNGVAVAGTVTVNSKTQLTVTFASGKKPAAGSGSLTAIVTTNNVSSGVAVQVATVQ